MPPHKPAHVATAAPVAEQRRTPPTPGSSGKLVATLIITLLLVIGVWSLNLQNPLRSLSRRVDGLGNWGADGLHPDRASPARLSQNESAHNRGAAEPQRNSWGESRCLESHPVARGAKWSIS